MSPFVAPIVRSATALGLALLAAFAQAAPFEIAIAPSRFELTAKGGERLGQSIDIHNLGNAPTGVSIRTLDWTYSPEGQITYHDELLPGSCRPWVTLERKLVRVPARGKVAFRFQVDVPVDAQRGECRFMLAVEGVEPAHKAIIENGGASLSLPVNGRIAVAVYMALNGAQPQLEMRSVGVKDVGGTRKPVVTVHNSGDAHGRLDGSLDATDGQNKSFELVPEGTPILPGQTRTLPLTPRLAGQTKAVDPAWPLKAQGTLDWDRGAFKVNADFQ